MDSILLFAHCKMFSCIPYPIASHKNIHSARTCIRRDSSQRNDDDDDELMTKKRERGGSIIHHSRDLGLDLHVAGLHGLAERGALPAQLYQQQHKFLVRSAQQLARGYLHQARRATGRRRRRRRPAAATATTLAARWGCVLRGCRAILLHTYSAGVHT